MYTARNVLVVNVVSCEDYIVLIIPIWLFAFSYDNVIAIRCITNNGLAA